MVGRQQAQRRGEQEGMEEQQLVCHLFAEVLVVGLLEVLEVEEVLQLAELALLELVLGEEGEEMQREVQVTLTSVYLVLFQMRLNLTEYGLCMERAGREACRISYSYLTEVPEVSVPS